MSEKLRNVCENCGFKNDFKVFLENVEETYIYISAIENDITDRKMDMVEWILENTGIDELKSLSEKERFLYGLGVLTALLHNEIN